MGTEDWYASLLRRPSPIVNKCFREKNCKSDEEIKEFLINKEIQVITLSKSYDTTNYNPEEKLQKIATQYNIELDLD